MSQPIKLQELTKLTSFEISPLSFKFGVVSLESDRYLSAKENLPSGEQLLTIIELQNNMAQLKLFSYTRKPNKADSAIMNPNKNIIALKAKSEGQGCMLQIFNMSEKAKLKSVDFPELITYWKWATPEKLAVVSASSVYYLDISKPNETYTKVMDRYENLKDQQTQIIGYCTDSSEKWGALYGIGSKDGGKTINGYIQLYLIADQRQQLLEGHCCTFGKAILHPTGQFSEVFCFVEKKANESAKLHITEISAPPAVNILNQGQAKFKKNGEMNYGQEQQSDFPIYMQVCQKYGLLIVVTKLGFLHLFEIQNCVQIFTKKISQDTIFIGTRNEKTDGALLVNKSGSLMSLNIDESALIGFIMNNCGHITDSKGIASLLASRYGLPGADGMFLEQFNRAISSQDIQKAAQIAANSPGTLLRNTETINKLKNMEPLPGQAKPIMVYFQTLLEKGSLNKFETLELVRPVLAQNKKQFIETWFNENKLDCCEELGDLIRPLDVNLAIKVYEKSNSKEKLMQCYLQTGQTDKVMQYSSQMGLKPDYNSMLRSMVPSDPQGAMQMAIKVCQQDSSINVHQIAEIFLQFNRLAELTQFLLECMKGNRIEDGVWQTQVLELNLMAAPQVADAILNMEIWTQYNKQKVAILCEQKGLYQKVKIQFKALENYQDLKDIKRICLNVHMLNLEWIVQYIGKLPQEQSLAVLQEMMRHNRQNMQVAVQVCSQNHAKLGVEQCVKVFESVSSFDGLFYFLGGILQNTNDKDVYFKYIESAVKVNQLKEVERVVRDKKDCYDPVRVKDFLKQIKLADPIPLLVLCDQHGFIDELIRYLYKNNFNRFIEIYILKYNPNSSAIVLATLIDLECDENYIKQILYNLRGNCNMEQLISEFEKRNRLRVLENWLDARVSEGNQIPQIHNALAKIKIDTNQDPQNYLINNQFYDSKEIGKYCEDRDPHLAYTAYKRAWGQCDLELIEVTNKNALYRLQARYLVERQSKEIWALVLDPSNEHRKALVDQVVSSALPDSKNVDEVSIAVQAFMAAELPLELLNLLEKLVLHNNEFGQYKKLQHLLLITAIKSEQSKVMDYIKRLDKFDGPAIAQIALEYNLNEEAFEIYKKFGLHSEALNVILHNINDIVRASEYAESVKKPEVWTLLGHSYINNYQVDQAIDCYLKSSETSTFGQVIACGEQNCDTQKFIAYLIMARTNIKDQLIDNALCFCYAKNNKLVELEELLKNPNSADMQRVGDRCYDEKLYEAAKMFFTNIKNNAKIASCLVRLGQYQLAIDSAKKANSPKTWKELCFACVDAEEFRLAALSGLNIIIHPDHLEDVIQHYERKGYPEHMIELLQQGMQTERAHIGIYTELGQLFAKYQPERLMEHCVQYFKKLNVSKLLRVCERYLLWPEAVYLYSHYDEFDNAINTIIEHSPSAFQHDQFIVLIQKVSNTDLYYKSLLFYMEEQPMQINGLLKALTNKLDLTKCVQVMKRTGYLPLILPFMKGVQAQNNQAINEALNNIYLENEDHDALRKSIISYDNFDETALAKQTENHQLKEMRRIASYLYRRSKRFEKSIELSKKDKQYKDCVDTAAESGSTELVESLLNFFVQNGEKEFFTVCSYTCYDLVRPDLILELSWRYGLMDFAMPFMIQVTRELTSKLENVQKKHQELEKKEEKKKEQLENQPLEMALGMMPGLGQQMLMPPSVMGGPYFFQNRYHDQGQQYSMGGYQNSSLGQGYNQFGAFQ